MWLATTTAVSLCSPSTTSTNWISLSVAWISSALHTLASLPHISIAGACATGTHGSGVRHGNLATAVESLQLMMADGEVADLHKGEEGFSGVVVGLGAVGVVTELTLRIEPRFDMRQWVFLALPMDKLEQSFDPVMRGAYSVSLFTTWDDESFDQVWLKERLGEDEERVRETKRMLGELGAVEATEPVHPVGEDPVACTPQLGEPASWQDCLPHFRMEFTPSSGCELQSEYFIAADDAPAALRALSVQRKDFAEYVLITEIRTIAADDLLMSGHFGRDSVAIHFTWRQHLGEGEGFLPGGLTPEVAGALVLVESVLEPFSARPHLGKLFMMSAERLEQVYPNLGSFREVVARFDPTGKFHNQFLAGCLLGERKGA